jgi:hypothetical protein
MSNVSLFLPYAVEDANRAKSFKYDMEVAAVICLSEAKRKKIGLLASSREKISFISKLYYPLWAFSWRNGSLFLDGLGLRSHKLRYMKPPDLEAFLEKVSENRSVRRLYRKTLKRHMKTFEDFVESKGICFEALLGNRNLLSEISGYVNSDITNQKRMKSSIVLVPPRVDDKGALKKVQKLVSHRDRIQSEIKGLIYTIKVLREETNFHEQKILREIDQTRKTYQKKILLIKSDVEKIAETKTLKLNRKIEEISKVAEKRLRNAIKKRDKYERELQKLEEKRNNYIHRRNARSHKGDKTGASRWSRRLKMCQKKISNIKKDIQTASKLVKSTQKQCASKIKNLKENHELATRREEKKISELESSLNSENLVKQQEIKEIRTDTFYTINLIEQLLDKKISLASELDELTLPWKPNNKAALVCIPFYLVKYENKKKTRYDVFPPTLVQSYEGIIRRIQRVVLSFSLENRIRLLLRPRSESLKDMLTSVFTKNVLEDDSLERVVSSLGSSNSLLKASDFIERLAKGTQELESEGWISLEERNQILDIYTDSNGA